MRRTLRCLAFAKPSVVDYVDYLCQADKELPTLHDIFPISGTVEDVTKFHEALCVEMERNAFPVIGFKVLPAGHESVTTMQGCHPVCFPIFANLFQRKSVSVKQDRLQYIEAAVCLEVRNLIEECSTADAAEFNTTAFSPSLEVTGSRFPFYAPSLSAMACDLDGCLSIVKGSDRALDSIKRPSLVSTRFVVMHNDEPVQTGAVRLCMENPFLAVTLASAYAKAIKAPPRKNYFVFCGGVCPRTPIQSGTYAFEWGPFGRLAYTVAP